MTKDLLLLVEDDATTREVLALLLDAQGWQVHEVESGEAAIEVLSAGRLQPAAILCDLHLPGIQGAALAEALRPLAGSAPLLAMSASEATAPDRAAYDEVLRKPLEPAQVCAACERTWSHSRKETASPGETSARTSQECFSDPGLHVISPETLLKLEKQMGTRAKDLYAFALADAGDRLRRMEESSVKGDETAFRKEAHALKGSAGMIGAERLAALAGEAETMSTVSSEGSSSKTVHRMHLACNEIRLMLETLFPM